MPAKKGDAVTIAGGAHAGTRGTGVRSGKKNALVLLQGEAEPRAFRPDELAPAPSEPPAVSTGGAASSSGDGSALRDAAARGDEAAVASLLARGAAAGAVGPDGQGPMQLALLGGHIGVVAALVAGGARLTGPSDGSAAGEVVTTYEVVLAGTSTRVTEAAEKRSASVHARPLAAAAAADDARWSVPNAGRDVMLYVSVAVAAALDDSWS